MNNLLLILQQHGGEMAAMAARAFALNEGELIHIGQILFREVVKTTILEQNPPTHNIDGGLCLHPLPQPQTIVFYCIATPLSSNKK